jgi:hypothetical protein
MSSYFCPLADDQMRDATLEQTRQRVAAWVNDERAMEVPWGFDVSEIRVPAVFYANPNATVTPLNHSERLVAHIRSAVLVASANAPSRKTLSRANRPSTSRNGNPRATAT